jgi:sensor domain CHASE-containing protein
LSPGICDHLGNVHFHTTALDGIYVVNEEGKIMFRRVAPLPRRNLPRHI